MSLTNPIGQSQQKPPQKLEAYLPNSSLGVALTALLILTPFSIGQQLNGQYLLGSFSLLVVAFLAYNAWSIRSGWYRPWLTFAGIVPLTMIFLYLYFPKQGFIATLWCFPTTLAFYFIMSERQAWVSNGLLLALALPGSWLYLAPDVALRANATLLTVGAFTAVFVRMINVQQDRLAKKEAIRREGMASVSHELRTPIANLVAEIEAMRDGIRPRDDQQLAVVARSLEHLSGLVDDLYQLALADVGALQVTDGLVRLDRLVNETLDLSQDALNDRGIKIVRSIQKNVFVQGDIKRLRQVIDNLMQNCQRYTIDDGRIWVQLKNKRQSARLIVIDSGPGVSDETLASLFQRFYRAESSRSRKTGGAGIGLALVKAMVRAHHGQVRAFHSPKGGLGIKVKLPLANNLKKQKIRT